MLNVNSFCREKKGRISGEVNGSYFTYQRFQLINEANGSFCIVLTHQPRLYAALNKRALTAGSIAIATIVNFDPRTFPLAFGNGDRNEAGSCDYFQRFIMKILRPFQL